MIKFKLFSNTTKESFTGKDILVTLEEIQKWAEENKVAPVSISAVDLTDEDLLINVGYHEKEAYEVKFHVKEISSVDEALETANPDMEIKINDFEDSLPSNILSHGILIAPGESKLYLIVMVRR